MILSFVRSVLASDWLLFRNGDARALARSFAYDSLATSTKSAYTNSWNKFVSLCEQLSVHPLPISAADFASVISYYAAKEMKLPSTMTMISAVAFAHTLNGFPSPSHHPSFALVLKGIKRKTFVAPKRAIPREIVINLMTTLLGGDVEVEALYDVGLIDWRTVALAVLTFSALARFDCAANLKPEHLAFSDSAVAINFPKSKTDQIGAGQLVSVHRLDSPSCPVLFLERYIRRLNWEYQLEHPGRCYPGPLLPGLTTRRISSPSLGDVRTSLPIDLAPLTRAGATSALRKGLERVGHPNAAAFTLHSGRRGGATAAAAAGCDLVTLKRQGRWKSDSCPQLYIDESVSLNTNFSKFIFH